MECGLGWAFFLLRVSDACIHVASYLGHFDDLLPSGVGWCVNRRHASSPIVPKRGLSTGLLLLLIPPTVSRAHTVSIQMCLVSIFRLLFIIWPYYHDSLDNTYTRPILAHGHCLPFPHTVDVFTLEKQSIISNAVYLVYFPSISLSKFGFFVFPFDLFRLLYFYDRFNNGYRLPCYMIHPLAKA